MNADLFVYICLSTFNTTVMKRVQLLLVCLVLSAAALLQIK